MPTFKEALDILKQNLREIRDFKLTKSEILSLHDGDAEHCPLCQANFVYGEDQCQFCPASFSASGEKICKKVCDALDRYQQDKIRRHHFTEIYYQAVKETLHNFKTLGSKSQ